jgi:DNA-binding response OmpR family regulator
MRPLITIVNDDAVFVRLINGLLREELAVNTLLLQAGEVAHESIKQEMPGLIVLDVSIDHPTNSWHLVDLLMLDPATATIPVILCSVADEALQLRLAKLEAAKYCVIHKPFQLDELLAQIRSALA